MTGRRASCSAFFLVTLGACASEPRLPPPPSSPPPLVSWPPLSSAPTIRETPDAPFRQNPPDPQPPVAWAPPHIESWSMANGVRVLFVERHDLPIVSVRVATSAGAGDFAGLLPGVAAFMGGMLEQGAGKRNALAISDEYEALGAEHGAWCDWDECVVRVKVLASRLDPALDLVADVTLHPMFQDAEMERQRKRWLASLQQEKSSPPAMEQNALAASLYGRAHPYGHGLRGQPGEVEKLTREEVVRVFHRIFVPGRTIIAAAGDTTVSRLRAILEARFGAWRAPTPERTVVAHAPPQKGVGRVVLVDVPGAAQSQVYLAEEGVAFSVPDRIALGVMNAILGGMFSSRINLDLREEHAYTYGAHSRFSMRHGAGPFAAGGAIFAEHVGDAIRELLAQVARIRDSPVTATELADAKENAKLALPARFEAVDEVTGALEDLAVYGLPLDEYATRAARIDAVTAGDVERVAKERLHPEAMRIVVTGDRARIERDVAALGLGAIEVRDAYGDPVK